MICRPLHEIEGKLRAALLTLGYNKLSIDVEEAAEVEYGAWSSSFLLVIEDEGDIKRIDEFNGVFKLKPDLILIKGFFTFKGIHAVVFIPPKNLCAPTTKETKILHVFASLHGKARSRKLQELKIEKNNLRSLILQGYLKEDRRGISLTDKGKSHANL